MKGYLTDANTEKRAHMPPNRVLGRFPAYKKTIERLYANSPTFREVCGDIAELVEWLEGYELSGKASSATYERGKELLDELDCEITDCLVGSDPTVAIESK